MFLLKASLALILGLSCALLTATNFAQSRNPKIKPTQKPPIRKPLHPPSIIPIDSSQIFQPSTPPLEPVEIPTGVHPAVSHSPGESRADFGPGKSLAYQRAETLLRTIGLDNPVAVQFENQQNSPLVISSASLKVIKTSRPGSSYRNASGDIYLIQVSINLSNATSKSIKVFGLYFLITGYTEPDGRPYIVSTCIDAYNTYTFQITNESEELQWLKNPEQLKIKVAGIVFADDSIWEEHAESKDLLSHSFNQSSDEPQEQVDLRPVPLNSVSPEYTEEARKNRTEGIVIAKVLVGADGKVKRVQVISGLSDGLNLEAIRAIYNMLFKPAMKNDLAVSYWMKVEIEFKL